MTKAYIKEGIVVVPPAPLLPHNKKKERVLGVTISPFYPFSYPTPVLRMVR